MQSHLGSLGEQLRVLAFAGMELHRKIHPPVRTRALEGELESWRAISPREWQVIERLRAGRKTTTIGRELGISPHTVRNHLKSINRKLGTRTIAELRERFGDMLLQGGGPEHAGLPHRGPDAPLHEVFAHLAHGSDAVPARRYDSG